jgi:hypothetical protein
MAKNIGQAGRPVVLCGTVLPEHLEVCPERRYFSRIYYLALVCEDILLVERLKQRPAWRGAGNKETLEQMVRFNSWLKEQTNSMEPPIALYDTSRPTLQETIRDVGKWIHDRL